MTRMTLDEFMDEIKELTKHSWLTPETPVSDVPGKYPDLPDKSSILSDQFASWMEWIWTFEEKFQERGVRELDSDDILEASTIGKLYERLFPMEIVIP